MNRDELQAILANHLKWARFEPDGQWANLTGALAKTLELVAS